MCNFHISFPLLSLAVPVAEARATPVKKRWHGDIQRNFYCIPADCTLITDSLYQPERP